MIKLFYVKLSVQGSLEQLNLFSIILNLCFGVKLNSGFVFVCITKKLS